MYQKLWLIVLSLLGALLLAGGLLAAVPPVTAGPPAVPQAPTAPVPTHYLTVTTTSDDGGMNERCETVSPCTLRRAINEVNYHGLDVTKRVYHIAFDISAGDPGYDAVNEVWILNVDSDNSSETFAYRSFGSYGHAIIDGATQPIGRDLADGPRIILRGDNQKGAFNLTGGTNVIRGLAFQGFGDNMVHIPGTSDNLIEYNWFGLTITGTEIYLRNPSVPEDGSGESGIYVQSGGSNNAVQNNILAGLDQGAIALDGDDSFVLSNTVGTRSDGTVPYVRPERQCRPNARYHNWFPGAGVQVYGHRNLVQNNRIVGMLYYSDDPLSTPEDALSVTGDDHVVRDNIIGIDADDQRFGVCGEGIHVGGSFGGHYVQVLSNTLVGSQGAAGILVTGGEYGYDLDAVTRRGNTIEDSGNEAFKFGDLLPSTLRSFNPAQVTAISGTTVTGTSGLNSPCAGCIVELFLDEIDTVTETIESLAIVTADGSGNWVAELPRTLAITEGIRTASTTVVDGQIVHPSEPGYVYHAGMTTKLSELYVQAGAPEPTEPPALTLDPPLHIPPVVYAPAPTPPGSYATTIIVTSADDPDDSQSTACSDVAHDQCTLRRALIEATDLAEDPVNRPILISFDIPTTSLQYDGAGSWIIQLYDTSQLNALPTLGSTDVAKSGEVVIDGSTQPDYEGLRRDDPRIIVRGADSTKTGLVINGEGNVIRSLAFQGFKDNLHLNHGGNIVDDCWFGLDTDGQGVYLRNPSQPQEGGGDAAIAVAVNADNNLFEDNVFLGMTGAAINLQGSDDNYIRENYIGTRSDGTINVGSVAPANICVPSAATDNWFGGTGVIVRGLRNQVLDNVFVGLLVQGGALQTPPNAISVPGGQYIDNLIQDNYIGRDATGADVWTCGRGVEMESARFTHILSNTIVNTHREAIYLLSGLIRPNADQMRGNIISNTVGAIDFGDLVPEALRLFEPARVTIISDTHVAGTEGDYCPYCWVDVYLDDNDSDVEALDYLGSDIADENGDWSLELPAPLAEGQGLRTISTIRNYGVIEYFEAGTSSKLSRLYVEQEKIYLPLVLRNH
ncbi:MAG: hypothetical protein ACP5J4_00250 [Anaerolineae bacterium]